MLYAAVWGESCNMAFEAADRSGLRVIMGKVMMDVGSYGGGADWPQPKTLQVSLAETDWLARHWHGADGGRLEYAVSPRFAVTCSHELMLEAARLADRHGCYIQTHLSENRDEIAAVARLFPQSAHYAGVYDAAGLLGSRTVLGHCVHLTRTEIKSLARRHAAVAHCPTSNFFLNSGLCPLDRLRAAGLRIGLGSDVAAGPELNLWQVMRSAIETQNARRAFDESVPELTPAHAFHLATRGGAEALGKEKIIGTIEPGFEADLLVLDATKILPYRGRFIDTAPPRTPEEILALCVYRATPAAVIDVFVRGRHLPASPT
jgi:guanine deaminase